MSVNFERAQAIFLDAIELTDSSERDSFLHEACGADQDMRNHLEILLNAHGRTGSFLEKGALAIDPTIDQPITEKPGTQIGPYKLLQKIGEGGMGVVYMAEQKKPVKRRVALKIIKPGMDTQQVVARFEAERQALAMMDHPNIAKVLDAGQTLSGRPYFVMELVKGPSLNNYCDKHHLTTMQRLQLFVDVCHAVQHAHHKGVIHRDIKPSNVMVTVHDGKPVPKVIDFGVAKAIGQQMTERTLFTEYGQIIGTPTYMSPEQADDSGDEVETRSDVYSLGVLLYELLTGSTPFETKRLRSAGYAEMLRIIREEEPPRPSARVTTLNDDSNVASDRGTDVKRLGSLLKHDLDWIVMKAMEKDRTRRYDSASHFAEDIGRYIEGAEVSARPRSTLYSVSKFCQRHKPLVASIAVITIALLAVTALSIRAYFVERDLRLAKTREVARYAAASGDAETAAIALAELLAYDESRWGMNDKRTLVTREKLATALSDSERLDEAIEQYKKLFKAVPATGASATKEKERIAKELIYALTRRALELSESPGAKPKDFATATHNAEQALSVAEMHSVGDIDRSYHALMMAAYRKGDYGEADRLANKRDRSRARTHSYKTLLTLAAINAKNGRLDLAEDWYVHAISVWSVHRTPEDKDAYEPFRMEVAGLIFRSEETTPRGTVTVEEREASLGRRISAHPQAHKLYRLRGYCRILLGQWTEAKADFATGDRVAKENGVNHSYYEVCHAWTLFHSGNANEFDRIRNHQLDELVNDRLEWSMERRETSVLYLSQPGKMHADKASLFNDSQDRTIRAFAAYRDGRFGEAILHCEAQMGELERLSPQCKHALAQLILAMAYHKSSLVLDAKKELKIARQMLMNQSPRPGHPRESSQVGYLTSVGWLEPLAILPEAEMLIEGELSEFGEELRSLPSGDDNKLAD